MFFILFKYFFVLKIHPEHKNIYSILKYFHFFFIYYERYPFCMKKIINFYKYFVYFSRLSKT